ncbi:hypothetical protein [Pedobacter nototheniae]|uniref:hypothetical protein n=1 Tax=Pedobacter nototheniae TaxID=2488994 RepID=UPI00292E2E84|nr:hypothetical protein [Pedobacter nototheniae]
MAFTMGIKMISKTGKLNILKTKILKKCYAIMSPFNIHIVHHQHNLTLTILPESDYYKIIYFGGIIGAIRNRETGWELVPEEEILPGDLPPFDYQHNEENRPQLHLNTLQINYIAGEIENHLSHPNENLK